MGYGCGRYVSHSLTSVISHITAGFNEGGIEWFVDLGAADPTYILPAAVTLGFLAVTEIGMDGIQMQVCGWERVGAVGRRWLGCGWDVVGMMFLKLSRSHCNVGKGENFTRAHVIQQNTHQTSPTHKKH